MLDKIKLKEKLVDEEEECGDRIDTENIEVKDPEAGAVNDE